MHLHKLWCNALCKKVCTTTPSSNVSTMSLRMVCVLESLARERLPKGTYGTLMRQTSDFAIVEGDKIRETAHHRHNSQHKHTPHTTNTTYHKHYIPQTPPTTTDEILYTIHRSNSIERLRFYNCTDSQNRTYITRKREKDQL